MGAGDGSKMQAEIWLKELERKGHQVGRINPWGHYDWKSYDIVHVFGFGLWNYDIIHWGSGINPQLRVLSDHRHQHPDVEVPFGYALWLQPSKAFLTKLCPSPVASGHQVVFCPD